MLDQMKMMGALAGLMKNQDKLKAVGDRIGERLKNERITGEAGGGAARVTVSCDMRVHSVEISEAMTSGMGDASSKAMAERLLGEAMDGALQRARDRAREIVNEEAQELGLPSIPGLNALLGQ